MPSLKNWLSGSTGLSGQQTRIGTISFDILRDLHRQAGAEAGQQVSQQATQAAQRALKLSEVLTQSTTKAGDQAVDAQNTIVKKTKGKSLRSVLIGATLGAAAVWSISSLAGLSRTGRNQRQNLRAGQAMDRLL